MRNFFYIHFFVLMISCSSSKTNSVIKKDLHRSLDSLVLVQSLPVSFFVQQPEFIIDFQELLKDSLIKKGFKIIDKEDAGKLLKEFMSEAAGIGNTERMKEAIEKVKNDQNYFVKQSELVDPIYQTIAIYPCENYLENCFIIKRNNAPNNRKVRSWVFEYNENTGISSVVNRVIDSLVIKR